jgi:hypothetical protein
MLGREKHDVAHIGTAIIMGVMFRKSCDDVAVERDDIFDFGPFVAALAHSAGFTCRDPTNLSRTNCGFRDRANDGFTFRTNAWMTVCAAIAQPKALREKLLT